jgi:general secretion pathway protein I
MSRCPPGRARGFTLIEVLVALAIVAIGMAAVMGAITSSAHTIAYMRDKMFAQWVAENQLATVRIAGQMQQAGNSDGDLDYAGSKWHWRQEVAATEIPGVMRIDMHVRPADVKGDDDGPWYTTMTGFQGDAVGVPNGYLPDWGAQLLPGSPGTNVGAGNNSIGAGGPNFGVQGPTNTLGGGVNNLGGPSAGLGGAGSQGPGAGGGPGTDNNNPPPPPPDDGPQDPQ